MKKNIIDINEFRVRSFVEYLRPDDLEMRKKLDYGYTFDGQTIFLYEIRPRMDNPKSYFQSEFAKIRYFKSRKEWQLYWMRASGNWEIYEPYPTSSNLKEILHIIEEDSYACFFG